MTGLLASAWLVAAFVGAFYLVAPAVRRTALGIVHPAIPWLGLELVFFGIGSAVLALVDGHAGPAWYVGGAVVAFGAGVAGSSNVAGRRATRDGQPPSPPSSMPLEESGVRRLAPIVIAAA
ncbi:MAG TPA: hypothetical protein VK656_05275, partial [Candidatus Acidoferrum sp.]|nr:hypothetical protein [Candidatus Acidoferrum sp.]